jgi:hypothetical protein
VTVEVELGLVEVFDIIVLRSALDSASGCGCNLCSVRPAIRRDGGDYLPHFLYSH